MNRLFLLAAMLWPASADPMTVKCDGRGPCQSSITFTGTIVAATALQVEAHGGVVVVRWQTSGAIEATDGERWGFYDRDLMALNLTITPGGEVIADHIGGRLAWAGDFDHASKIALAGHTAP